MSRNCKRKGSYSDCRRRCSNFKGFVHWSAHNGPDTRCRAYDESSTLKSAPVGAFARSARAALPEVSSLCVGLMKSSRQSLSFD
jgi:hypothetical protein